MKSAQISEYGDPSVIAINEIEKPSINSDQVLVEVQAASINPFDSKIRSGAFKEMIPLNFPATLGGDIAGTITQIGENVNGFAVGDKVYGQAQVVAGNSGAFAEFAATSAGQIAKMPSNLDYKQAASLPLVAVSALQALTSHIGLQKNQKIFIHGGAGGIGTIAIQVAKHLGAYVATSATGRNIQHVKNLGANEVIDYKTQDFSEILSDYDAVFDTVGGDDVDKTLLVLKKGGVVVSMAGKADEQLASELGVTAISQNTKVDTEILNELTKLVEANAIKPQIDKTFSLDDIQTAFETLENGSVKGKVVIVIR